MSRSHQGHFCEGSRSRGKVMSYYVAGSEIPFLMASLLSCMFVMMHSVKMGGKVVEQRGVVVSA